MTQVGVPALRSQDMVFTLFGDYLLARDQAVGTGSLITLLGQLGLSPMAVRTVLSRMTRKGWLAGTRRGTRSWYGLTRKGRRLLEAGHARIYHQPAGGAWDGRWSVITFSIPEERRRLRDRLRVRLAWLGCGPLSNGVWITPHDVTGAVREFAAELKVTKHLQVFRGAHAGFADTAALVRQCWDLDALDRRYERFIARWTRDFERCRSCGLTGARAGIHPPCTEPADCFRRRFLLVHEYRTFPLDDPFLPAALLPDDWHGGQAARLFATYHDVLAAPAERYVADVVRAGDDVAAAR